MDPHNIRKMIADRVKDLEGLIAVTEKKISKFPAGRIRISHRGDDVYCYLVDESTNRNGKIIDKDNIKLISDLMQKNYYLKILEQAKLEITALQKALDRFPDIIPEDVFLTLSGERKAFIKPIFRTDDAFAKEWLATPFTPKEMSDKVPYFETLKGERVRSKSEMIIADRLSVKGIPYKYECPLKLKSGLIHPDFTILRLSDRQEIYLEHCGMMDDPKYAKKMVKRTNNYAMSGIVLGDRLFHLYETSDLPMDVRVLDSLIENKFR